MFLYVSSSLRWGVCLCAAVVCTGCATVTGGSRDQKVNVDSKPEGAQVIVDGKSMGVTPTEVTLKRSVDHEILLVKPGFESYQTTLKSGLNPWIFGNLAVGGVLGLAVDIGCDSCHRLQPDCMAPNLSPGTASASGPPHGMTPAAN